MTSNNPSSYIYDEESAYIEARDILRSKDVEQYKKLPFLERWIIRDPQYSFFYAKVINKELGKRWRKGEVSILNSFHYSMKYAELVIKNRWPAFEHNILTGGYGDPSDRWMDYTQHLINTLYDIDYNELYNLQDNPPKMINESANYDNEEIEELKTRTFHYIEDAWAFVRRYNMLTQNAKKLLLTSPEHIWLYASSVRKARWRMGEVVLLTPQNIRQYPMSFFSYLYKFEIRIPEMEEEMLTYWMDNSLHWCVMYAQKCIKGRWPLFEQTLLWRYKHDTYSFDEFPATAAEYAREVMNGDWPEFADAVLDQSVLKSVRWFREVMVTPNWPELEKELERSKQSIQVTMMYDKEKQRRLSRKHET